MELQRITTEYIEAEDRLRLAGEGKVGEGMQGWLTQRLFGRLLPHLVGWLERQPIGIGDASDSYLLAPVQSDMLQDFVQQAACAELVPQVPVCAKEGEVAWLVHAVDLAFKPEGIVLTFRGQVDVEQASFGFTAQSMRQWLGIVYDQYVQAEWSLALWPQWISGRSAAEPRSVSMLH